MDARTRGFSLIELVAGVAILAVLLAVAAPAMGHLRADAIARSGANELIASLNMARVQAVSRRTPVTVCPATPEGRCRADSHWEGGWMVFVDAGRTGQPQAPEDVIQHLPPPASAGGLGIRSSAGRRFVRYLPDGRVSGTNLSIRICPAQAGVTASSVVVSMTGRVRSERHPAGTSCEI